MDEFQTKAFLPILVILGTTDFTKLKKHQDQNQRITKNSAFNNYEELCSLDVLGISEKEDVKNESVLNKFKSQLLEKKSFYETGLIWKEGNYS